MLKRLGDHHQGIHALLSEAGATLHRPDPSRTKALALLRWQLKRRLRSYQLFKHAELFDPICRAGDPGRATLAFSMKARCIAIGETYDRHVQKWSACGVASAWTSYVAESTAIVQLIRDHLVREKDETADLLSGSGSPRSLSVG